MKKRRKKKWTTKNTHFKRMKKRENKENESHNKKNENEHEYIENNLSVSEKWKKHSHVIADKAKRKEVINCSSTNHNQQADYCDEIGDQWLLFSSVNLIFNHLIAV